MRAVAAACRRAGARFRVLGLGSDVLAADEGVRGIVVRLAENLAALEVDGETVRVQGARTPTSPALRARRGSRATSSPPASRARWEGPPS